MFHKIKNVFPLPEYRLSIQFAEGRTKIYDALWCLNESTLRKAISYGKLIEGVDGCKFGKSNR